MTGNTNKQRKFYGSKACILSREADITYPACLAGPCTPGGTVDGLGNKLGCLGYSYRRNVSRLIERQKKQEMLLRLNTPDFFLLNNNCFHYVIYSRGNFRIFSKAWDSLW